MVKKTKKKSNNLNYCSPRNNKEKFTCFSRPSLKRIIKYWNEHNSKDRIKISEQDTREKLWNKINQKLKAICDDEYCWLKQPFISSKSVVIDDYRPEMPNSWNSNKNEWLTTRDIEKVMNQYMKKHNDFIFIGAVPIDFDKEVHPGVCVVNELCKIKMRSFFKKGIAKIGIVFNLDPHDKPGSHWVSFFGDLKKGKLYYFDSYGLEPPKEVSKLVDRLIKQGEDNNMKFEYKENKLRHQYNESECGVYSINFIEQMLEGTDFDVLSSNKIPDKKMVLLRKKYFVNLKNPSK